TWVDSALFGSQEEASFCWALLSLPARGPASANTTIQKARTAHLLQRPAGKAAIRRALLMTTPSIRPSSHGQSRYIATLSWSSEFLVTAISRPPDTRWPCLARWCDTASTSGEGQPRLTDRPGSRDPAPPALPCSRSNHRPPEVVMVRPAPLGAVVVQEQ